MKLNNIFSLALLCLLSFSSLPAQESASIFEGSAFSEALLPKALLPADNYIANFSISHGHCQLPLEARFTNVNIESGSKNLDGLKIDFDLSTHSIKGAPGVEAHWADKMKSARSFDANQYPTMRFVCQGSYNLGTNWRQLNGTLTIKGQSIKTQFRARAIYDKNQVLQKFVLDGQVNLKEFGVNEGNVGGPDDLNRTMFINMEILADAC